MGVVGQVYHFFTKILHLVPLLAVYQSQWSTHPCSDLPTLILQSNEIPLLSLFRVRFNQLPQFCSAIYICYH